MKVPLFKRQISNGFALIATILLMVLLAIITVGTLSLSVVTLRTGNQDSAQARARANAPGDRRR
jgi:Tfp pilus assembly protein PilX